MLTLSAFVIIGLTSLSCFPHLAWIMTLFITTLWVNMFFHSVISANPLQNVMKLTEPLQSVLGSSDFLSYWLK